MSIVVNCNCGKKFKARDEMAGRKVRCPDCKTVLRIPGDKVDSSVTAVAEKSAAAPGKSSSAPEVDEAGALLRYEAVQKKKQMDAESEAAYKLEQQKLIASYDQLTGKGAPADLAAKKKKDELTESGVPRKPTVATKAADAAGSFFSNAFVKYLMVVLVLGGLTFASVSLVQYITGYVNEDMISVGPREDRIKALTKDARDAIAAKDVLKANKCLEEILRIDPAREKNRTFLALREQVDALTRGK